MAEPSQNLRGFSDRLHSLLAFDRIRLTRILEILQYAFLFTICAVAVGYFVDNAFQRFYPVNGFKEDDKIKGPGEVVRTVLTLAVQVMIGAVCVFYIRKIIDLVNPIVNLAPSVYIKHRNVSEASGELSFAIAYIGIQVNAMKQLEKLRTVGQQNEE